MDCNSSYVSYITKSWNYVFGSCSILMLVLSVTCDCLNMMTIDCMLSRRSEKFKAKTVVYFLYLLTTA